MGARLGITLAAQLAVVAALAVSGPGAWEPGPVLAVVGFAAAFGLVGLAPVHLELRRAACTVTLQEAVLVAAMVVLPPSGVAIAAALGEAVACLALRQHPRKVVFNVGSLATAAFVGAVAADAIAGGVDVRSPLAWSALLAGALSFSLVSQAATAIALSVVEHRSATSVFAAAAPTATTASALSAAVGVAAVVLHSTSVAGPLLLVPLCAAVAGHAALVTSHRAERLRFERLYAASSRTVGLSSLDGVLRTLAAEARELVTGASALCVAPGVDGEWIGAVVGDDGTRSATAAEVGAARRAAGRLTAAEVPTSALAAAERPLAPAGSTSVVVATPDHEGEPPVILAVARDIGVDSQVHVRAEVLRAFAGHAALTVANASLFEQVEQALRHQVDLNRQKDDFVAAVSHELRTPLTTMLGSVGTLQRLSDRLDAATQARLLEMASGQGRRLQRLIDELLLLATVQHDSLNLVADDIDLAAIAADAVADVRQGGERVVVDVNGGGAPLRADASKVSLVVLNLVENATKYAPDGPIEVRVRTTGGEGVVEVVDHGPGVPAGDRERVFERFVQLDQSSTRRGGGIGMGLYLCRRLAELMGGSLSVVATPGGGATFRLVVPSAAAATPRAEPAAPPFGALRRPARPAAADPVRPTRGAHRPTEPATAPKALTTEVPA